MIFSSMIKTLLLCIASLTLLATPSTARYYNHILSGEQIGPGQALIEGSYSFVMQEDCNLVLYDLRKEIWSSGTNGKNSGCYLSLEKNGNLVVYDNDNKVVWETKSNGKVRDYILILQNDLNVVIFGNDPWGTSTNKYNLNRVVIAGAHNGTVKISGAEKNKVGKMGKIIEVGGDE